jgi:UDP:flavonoid glycosyltransferase YjiC (YdhE family)/ubiquinone/menaquinone biosynthesis C-methylase UbiE/nitroreductase
MNLPSLPVLKVMLRELATSERSPRVPEPDLVMDDPAKVAAYVRAGGEDGARSSVYLYHSAQISDVIRPGDLVVDLACGPLNQLAIVARLNPESRFVGIDLSQRMLQIAKGTIDEMGLKNVTLRQGDITRLDLADRSVDVVVSTVALHHLQTVEDLDRAFAEINRILRPGGGLYLVDFGHLRSERSIQYFAYQYAHMQPDLYVLDYLYSLRAAFPMSDFKAAYERHLTRRARFYSMRPFPFMLAIKSESRRGEDPALRHKLLTRRRELSPFSQRDLSDIIAVFRAGGLDARGLDKPIPSPFPFGVRPRGRLYAPDPTIFLHPEEVPESRREKSSPPGRLAALVEAAVCAPSGSNAQPWRFLLDEESGRIDVFVDSHVDGTPMNAGHRMSRIGVGAAVENLLRTAERSGWKTELTTRAAGALATIRVTAPAGSRPVVEKAMAERATNRRRYDGRSVAPAVLERLCRATPPLGGVATLWITDRERLRQIASVLGRAEKMAFAEKSIRQAMLSRIRFDAPPEAHVEEGLPVASLELTGSIRWLLPRASHLPKWVVKGIGLASSAGRITSGQVLSASGLCLVAGPDEEAPTDLAIGRAGQRAWLALTQEGLAAQPLTSLLVLENMLYHGTRELSTLGRRNIERLRDELRRLVPELGGARPGFLLRFGFAPSPSARSGRLPLDVVSESASLPGAAPVIRGTDRKKILFIAEAVTLSTVARPATLARTLDPARFDVTFATAPRFVSLFPDLPFPVRPISSIPPEQFRRCLENGSPIYDASTLRAYVEEDVELLRSINPDAVVGDFRISLSISARRLGIPYLAITDSCWSPYAREPLVLGENPLRRLLGSGPAKALFGLLRSIALAHHSHALNCVRKEYGLPPLGHDLRHLFTDADHVLYADVPELAPVFDEPPRHHYLGPILWSAPVALPPGWNDLPADRPLLSVSLGSTGRAELLPEILAALGDLPVNVVAATAGRIRIDSVPANTLVADFLPGDRILARARLAICNGGGPATQQALAAAVPILGIPGNMNQILNMRSVVAAGAGEALETTKVSAASVRRLVLKMLEDPAYGEAALSLSRTFENYDAAERFGVILDRVLAKLTAAA